MKHIVSAFALASVAALVGCAQEETKATSASNASPQTQQVAAIPEGLFLEEGPADAVTLAQARATAKPGEEIAFTGYIGGRAEPFTEGRALFLVADSDEAPACTDGCPKPWDACCIPSETVAANSATVQVLDGAGQALRMNLKGENDLAPGSRVTVIGKVREANEAIFVVDATGIRVDDHQP
ncbi:MAG: hypothetical protein PWP23_1736 [Candidatus Sumerlaeota bacterium]|nr:hypothetical protein [Candidatus Sumerlaeota bacterium]